MRPDAGGVLMSVAGTGPLGGGELGRGSSAGVRAGRSAAMRCQPRLVRRCSRSSLAGARVEEANVDVVGCRSHLHVLAAAE